MVPLTWASLSVPSQIMLPIYPAVALWKGVSFIVSPDENYASPALTVAKSLMPMRGWGCLFVAVGVMLLAGYAMRSRDVTVFVLCMGACMCAVGRGDT